MEQLNHNKFGYLLLVYIGLKSIHVRRYYLILLRFLPP